MSLLWLYCLSLRFSLKRKSNISHLLPNNRISKIRPLTRAVCVQSAVFFYPKSRKERPPMTKKKTPQTIEECNAELELTQKKIRQYENRSKMPNCCFPNAERRGVSRYKRWSARKSPKAHRNSMTLPHCSVMPTVCWDLRHSRPWIMPKAFTKNGSSPTPARTAAF